MANSNAASAWEFRRAPAGLSRAIRVQRAGPRQRLSAPKRTGLRNLVTEMEIPYTVHPREDTGLYNAKLGIWLFLASEVMLFGALFSSYILLRVGAPEGTWPHHILNVPIGTVNTIVLIISSVTRSEEHA